MLLEFKCSNHKSIRDEAVFSTVTGADYELPQNIALVAGVGGLKAEVFGSNGAGKSNFLDVIAFVKKLVMESVSYQYGQLIVNHPHKLEGFSKPTFLMRKLNLLKIRLSRVFSKVLVAIKSE